MATLEDVRRIASALPGASESEGTRFGFSVEVKGKAKGFVWSWMGRVHPKRARVENRSVIAIVVPSLSAKDVIVFGRSEAFVTDPHYANYPAVLARLDRIEVDELEDLILDAWRCKTPAGKH